MAWPSYTSNGRHHGRGDLGRDHLLDLLQRHRRCTSCTRCDVPGNGPWPSTRGAIPCLSSPESSPCVRLHRAELRSRRGLGGRGPGGGDGLRAAHPGYGEAMAGQAFYRRGEIHRFAGRRARPSEAYRSASRTAVRPSRVWRCCGWRRAGRRWSARSARLAETTDRLARSRLLRPMSRSCWPWDTPPPSRRDGAARSARPTTRRSARLVGVRARHGPPCRRQPEAALRALRQAWQLWRDLDVPYEAARARVLVGLPAAPCTTRTPRRWVDAGTTSSPSGWVPAARVPRLCS